MHVQRLPNCPPSAMHAQGVWGLAPACEARQRAAVHVDVACQVCRLLRWRQEPSSGARRHPGRGLHHPSSGCRRPS